MDNTEFFRHDLNVAARVQSKFISRPLPAVPGFEIAAHYQPCELVSGDYIDVARIDDRRIALTLADVSGKGVSAGIIVAMLRTFTDTHLPGVVSPSDLVSKLNEFLRSNIPDTMFVTMFFAILDSRASQLSCVNCGHLPPVLYEATKKSAHIVSNRGMALRMRPTPEFYASLHEQQILLNDGDTLLVYTDGVTEAHNASGELFETERLARLVTQRGASAAKDLLGHILVGLEQYAPGIKLTDDVTMLAVRRSGRIQESVTSKSPASELERVMTIPQAARHFGVDVEHLHKAIQRGALRSESNEAFMDTVVRLGDVATLMDRDKIAKPAALTRVLVVSTDHAFGEMIELEIRRRAQVRRVSVSPDAVNIAQSFEPELIVFEVCKPFAEALALLSDLRKKLASVPVIVYSAQTTELRADAHAQEALRASGVREICDRSLGMRAILPSILPKLRAPQV